MPEPRLDTIQDEPELFIEVAGREYRFGELKAGGKGGKGKLQSYLRRTVPNPLLAVKDYLHHFEGRDRDRLLDGARRDAIDWPPDIETNAAKERLMSTEDGQIEVLWVALQKHQPTATRDDAATLYRDLEHEARSRPDDPEIPTTVLRIYNVVFGRGDPLAGRTMPLPKGGGTPNGATIAASPGPSSIASANND